MSQTRGENTAEKSNFCDLYVLPVSLNTERYKQKILSKRATAVNFMKYLKIIWNLPSGVLQLFSVFSGVSEVIWPLILCKRVECVNWFQCKFNMHFYSARCLVVWLNGIPMCSEFHNEDWTVPRSWMSKKIKLIPTILITFCSS